ncbi:MAG TPA: CpsD/CapB family tyrosine-protein kinase [Dongiaceae bacterium]|nr:CpsD/CapB family tyrosine-protein kinase [Dongiaceae bacterium]
MSRIHEALKKAAQERNAQLVSPSGPDLVELEAEASARIAVAPSLEVADLTLPQQPIVHGVPGRFERLVQKCNSVQWKVESKSSIFVRERENFLVAEKFRTLRSRLYQIAAVQKLRSIVVSSSVPAEGKTFVAASLAVSFIRQADKRVLLIDGDLRASRLHLQLGAPEKPGLSDFLRGNVTETDAIQVGPGGNLCFIPGGSDVTNPSELLHSERMKNFIDRMSEIFDWVIIDSPPAIAVHDASILADMCDGVLFVVRAGSTDFEVAKKASSEFREKNLLGVVLNRVDRAETYNSYYYGYSGGKEPQD